MVWIIVYNNVHNKTIVNTNDYSDLLSKYEWLIHKHKQVYGYWVIIHNEHSRMYLYTSI